MNDRHEDCEEQCREIAIDRMRYFTGRYMTARDFGDEQKYFLSRRDLHNRVLHGWGIACGLYVYPHPTAECTKDHVAVKDGIAVDCCGREIVVPRSVPSPPIPMHQRPQEPENAGEQDRWYPLLCLRYVETAIECVPVLYNEGNCDPQRREYSRVREGYELEWHWVRQRDLPAYGWRVCGGGCEEHSAHHPCAEDDCDPPGTDAPGPCIEPKCPLGHCVPLALIHLKPGSPIEKGDIETSGRPVLKPPREALTHICHTNWKHGSFMSVSELKELKRLEIHFDRRLQKSGDKPGDCGPTGINPCTFVVQAFDKIEHFSFVPYSRPPHLEQEHIAVYTIDPVGRRYGHNVEYDYLENHVVYITLKCDFILDCHGLPVDGDHLGGKLPSGDDIRGGTFESWFEVLPDHVCHNRRQEQEKQGSEERAS